jgi:hypothetical protein
MPLMVELLQPPEPLKAPEPEARPLPVVRPQPLRQKPAPVPRAPAPLPVIESTAAARRRRLQPGALRRRLPEKPAPPYPPLSRRMARKARSSCAFRSIPKVRADSVEIKTSSGSQRLDEAAQNRAQLEIHPGQARRHGRPELGSGPHHFQTGAVNMQENSFGFAHLWASGDTFRIAVAVILAIMSLASWYLILAKAWDWWRCAAPRAPSAPSGRPPALSEGIERLRAAGATAPTPSWPAGQLLQP